MFWNYSMQDLKYWLAFSKIKCDESIFITTLWKHFGSIKEAWLASNADLLEIEGLSLDKIENFVQKRKSVEPDKLPDEIEKRGINVITIGDKNYPALLKEIYNPPAALFVKGNLEECNLDKTLAIVGSRKASHYIIEILNKIIGELSDITIVSGMAFGVDTCAHKAAIKNSMKTIAVIGSGFDNIYPEKNKELFKEIANGHGAVISEYYPTAEPFPFRFPLRNRIISGLSKGTLIAEAGLKSGALITARICLEQNRELMCIPGLVTNPNTEGIHKLIKEGAGLVTCGKDIFEHLNWQQTSDTDDNKNNLYSKLLDNEKKVYEILNLEPMQVDGILNQTGLNIGDLMVVLTSLELKGIIKQLPGDKYTRSY